MKVTEIKGTVPGAGKTTALVSLFVTSNLPNKILLCPSNKDRQVCIEKATMFGMDVEEAEKNITTLRRFKKNFYKHVRVGKYFDTESMEYCEVQEAPTYITKHSKPHYGKIWNIFIDEASMISKEEMDDLVNNWRINNLVLCGDSLQFGPIGNKEVLFDGADPIEVWLDEGLPYDLNIDNQFLLNKSLRSIDPKLTKAINLIKEGKVIEAISLIYDGKNPEDLECKYKDSDWHIAYTNSACDRINKKYTDPKRFIITLTDHNYKFWKSEILDINDRRFVNLNDKLIMANSKDPDSPLFDEWLEKHATPAYAVTCHKLQGTTISEGKIYIHLADVLYGLQDIVKDNERADILQKFLYVAVSRATKASQIEFYGFGDNSLIEDIYNRHHPLKKDGKGGYVPDLEKNTIGDELAYLQSKMHPMVDGSIKRDAFTTTGGDKNLNQLLEDVLEYDVSTVEDVPQEYKDKISKAHSGHRKNGWTDEKLMSYTDVADLRRDLNKCDIRYREELFARYTKLTGIVIPKETEEERKERISKAPKWTDERIMSYDDIKELKNAIRDLAGRHKKKLLARWEELHNVDAKVEETKVEESKIEETKVEETKPSSKYIDDDEEALNLSLNELIQDANARKEDQYRDIS